MASGEKISGPAARRAVAAAATTPRFEGRIVPAKFARKAAAFLARDGVVLYDNPDAHLICAFKHDNALYEPEPGGDGPAAVRLPARLRQHRPHRHPRPPTADSG
ncbi:hypothetical protein [Streptomyces virginiae]